MGVDVQPIDVDAGAGGGGNEEGGGGGGSAIGGIGGESEDAEGGRDAADIWGGRCIELPVSREVQPPVRKAGAGPAGEWLLGVWVMTAGSGEGGSVRGVTEAHPLDGGAGALALAVAQPGLLFDEDATRGAAAGAGDETVAQPGFLKPLDVDSLSPLLPIPSSAVGATSAAGGFTIFTPAALAIFRSSFSSRFRSFSLRLSTSSCVLRLARWAACISRKRALWWCA